MLIGLMLRPRESLYATHTWLGLSGLAVLNVSDWVMLGEVSGPVTRSTSAAPYARGTGLNSFLTARGRGRFWIAWDTIPPREPERCAWPQAIIMAPARKFSCLSMPSS